MFHFHDTRPVIVGSCSLYLLCRCAKRFPRRRSMRKLWWPVVKLCRIRRWEVHSKLGMRISLLIYRFECCFLAIWCNTHLRFIWIFRRRDGLVIGPTESLDFKILDCEPHDALPQPLLHLTWQGLELIRSFLNGARQFRFWNGLNWLLNLLIMIEASR